MREHKYWLKSVGASDDLQADDWPDSAPQELHHLHFPEKGRPTVKPGDYLVYYASGQERIIGIVEVFTPPSKDSGEERWPWRCEVRPRIILSRIRRSPLLDVMSDSERDFRLSVRQQSHIEITEAQYLRARDAIEKSFDRTKGDQFFAWPTFETVLNP